MQCNGRPFFLTTVNPTIYKLTTSTIRKKKWMAKISKTDIKSERPIIIITIQTANNNEI